MWKTASSVFTEVSLQVLIPLNISDSLIDSWKCLTKVLFVISFGQTHMTEADGVYPVEVEDIHLDKTSLSNLITETI